MNGNFQALLKKFCLESTVLGLKYFYLYPDRLSRCFWSVNMVAVTGLSFVLTYNLYSRFAKMPTQITIDNQIEPVANLPYPSITICSPNQITRSYMNKIMQTLGNEVNDVVLETSLRELLGFYEILPDLNEKALAHLQSIMNLKNITVPYILDGTAQSCDSFLKLCYFEMIPYTNCETVFLPILTAYGLCCTFNNHYYFNGKTNQYNPDAVTRTVQTTGEGRGLMVVGDYEPADALEGTLLSGGAIKVLLSDATEFPTFRESTLVETNSESFHILNAAYTYCSEEVMTLATEDRRCYLDHEFKLPYFHKYSKSDCDLTCVIGAIEDECHCTMFFIPNVTRHRMCNLTHIPCIMNVKFYSKSMYDCDCLPDCNWRQYGSDIVLGNFNAMPYMLKNIYEGIKFNDSSFIMNFFFINSIYLKKKQETVMSLTILASNLGGIFGLCLGCSWISVLEILFYLYIAVKNYFTRRRQRCVVRYIEYNN